jgi:hypothetical protein
MELLLALPILFALALASDYAGADACRECHPAEYAAQSKSAHAGALARSHAPQPGEWAFGAGKQAITFVRRLDPETYVELGQTWYRKIDGYAATPGHPDGLDTRFRIFDPSAGIMRCFSCHSTGPLSLAADGALVPMELGVRCEDCHGPSAAHVHDPAHVHPQNPGKLNAAERNDFCGSCHRMPAAAGETPDLRAPWNVRHQPLLLAASACFQSSQGRLSCLTCHSPHAPLERNLAAYNTSCAKCHVSVKHRVAVAGRACAACHMPEVRPTANLAFANHRIAIYGAGDPLTPLRPRR